MLYCVCMCVCASFQAKQRALTFSAQICPKKDLGVETEKNNVGIRTNIFETHCVPILSKLVNFDFFGPNLLKNGFRTGSSGLERLGFLVHESPCSSKQVQENVVRLKILFTLRLFEVHVFTSSCTSSCTK